MATIIHPIAIRLSEPSDSLRIAEIQIATWRSAYSGIVPVQFLSSMSVAAHERSWRGYVGHPHSPLFVATRGAECIGFCHVTPARDPDLEGAAEVVAIYVAPQCQRQGAGGLLMSSALEFAASSRYESLALWVLALNRAGRSFYEQAGFTTDGRQKQISLSGTVLDEVRYHRHTRSIT
jgi:ribosomal protein S18 acetylase RimI-like enzyme